METITKKQMIEALNEKTSSLSLRKNELIDKLFEIQVTAEKQIKELDSFGFINMEDWGISYLRLRYNDYLLYEGELIEYSTGGYDGGDFNSPKPLTNHSKLVDFVLNSVNIIESMQKELEEKLNNIEAKIDILHDK